MVPGPGQRDGDLDPDPRGGEGRGFAVPPGLTPAQHEAVLAEDPLLCVLAGAGAGKTRVLTLRVGRRTADGSADPDHILVCTFSRKAADELRHRLWAGGAGEGVHAGTIHRTALSLLRQHRADRGLPPPTILGDRRSLVAEVLSEPSARPRPRSGGGRSRGPTDVAARVETEIGWAKARMVRPDGYERAAAAEGRRTTVPAAVVAGHFRQYEQLRRRRGLLDLDDLLSTCADTLAEDGAFADAVRWRFRHLFVDEMQDVNPAQFRLLSALLGDEPDLFVVGDPNQSVYGWNGADPALLAQLPEIFVGTRVIRLDENHRSSPQVVAVAAAALGLGGPSGPTSARADGAVPRLTVHDSDADEARWVARHIWRAHQPGRNWSSTAVLARTNAQLAALAEALTAERVPHHIAGGDLGPASDLAGPPRSGGWAPTGAASADDDADETGADETGGPGADDRAELDHRDRAELDHRDRPEATPSGERPTDAVTLSTFHRAKGLQWRSVYVVGLSEGLVPLASSKTGPALAEERRLLYVALTRAEEELSCSWSRRRGEGTGPARRPSRWLGAIEAMVDRLDRENQPPDPAEAAARLRALRAQLGARTEDPG